jgi:hypothetical protein
MLLRCHALPLSRSMVAYGALAGAPPMTEATLFEQEYGRHVWRLEATEWNGERRLQVWPWFRPKEGGDLRPCSPRLPTGGGFAVPLERLPALIAALSAAAPDDPFNPVK